MNGKKTWFGIILTLAPQLVMGLSRTFDGTPLTIERGLVFAGELLAIIGAAHKLYKGE